MGYTKVLLSLFPLSTDYLHSRGAKQRKIVHLMAARKQKKTKMGIRDTLEKDISIMYLPPTNPNFPVV